MGHSKKLDIVCPLLQLSIKLQWSIKLENKATVATATTLRLLLRAPPLEVTAPEASNKYLLMPIAIGLQVMMLLLRRS